MAKFHQHDFEQQLHRLLQNQIDSWGKDAPKKLQAMAIAIELCSKVKNPQKRFRWDLLYSTPPVYHTELMLAIYAAEFNDTHVDRSLHRFCKTLNLPFYPQEYDGK